MADQKKLIFAALAVILAIAGASFIYANSQPKKNYDVFAQCLTEKGIKLYGAYWCSHCQDQKKMFGESVKYLDYVECAIPGSNKQTEACSAEGINAYPTWKYADGSKESAVKSLEELSQISRCAL